MFSDIYELSDQKFHAFQLFLCVLLPEADPNAGNRVWAKPNKCFEAGFVKSDSKIASWYQLALLAAVANSKIFVQKNNRPLQVELENGRS